MADKILIITSGPNHGQFYETLYNCFSPKGFKVVYVGKKETLESISPALPSNPESVQYIEHKPKETYTDLFTRIQDDCNSSKAIIVDELYSGVISMAKAMIMVDIQPKYFMVIHNLHEWLKPKFGFNMHSFKKWVSKKLLLLQSSGIVVISSMIEDYAVNTLKLKKVFTVPFVLPKTEEKIVHPQNNILTIAVPGTLDGNRRHYSLILDAFERLWEDFDAQVVLKIVGSVKNTEESRKILERCRNLSEKYDERLIYWEDRMSNQQFENELIHSDIILSGTIIDFSNKGRRETYGSTKESGTVFHAVNLAKPIAVLNEMKVFREIETQVVRYSDAESLKVLISKILGGQLSLDHLMYQAQANRVLFRQQGLKHVSRLINVIKD